MITNDNDIARAVEFNKIYVPELYNNSSYFYIMNNDNIQIITNLNCYTNYNTTYCTCYLYSPDKNIITKGFDCNRNTNSNYQINYSSITSDVNFSDRIFTNFFYTKGILLLMVILGILFATMLLKGKGGFDVY